MTGPGRSVASRSAGAQCPVACRPHQIVAVGNEALEQLARDQYLRGLARPEFIDELAVLFADINALHPFREGKGRALRSFLTQLVRDAGHSIRWAAMDLEGNATVSRAAHRGDNTLLQAMLEQLVAPVDASYDDPKPAAHPPRPREPGD